MEVKTDGENLVITIKMSTPGLADEMQRTLDYARVLELTRGIKKISQEESDAFADQVRRDGWNANKNRFVK